MNAVLVGPMGSGKSTVGRLLADLLGRPFIDTDQMVVEEAGQSISEIFAAEGEAGFRSREAAAVAEAASRREQIIATGGGAVLAPANREALRRTGLLFWLDAPVEELFLRAAADQIASRPLLSGPDPMGRLRALVAQRAPIYQEAAHHRIETGGRTAREVAEQIAAILCKAEEGANPHAPGRGKP